MMVAKQNGGTAKKPDKNSMSYRFGALLVLWAVTVVCFVLGRLAWDASTWIMEWLQ